jgi:hypothetical protein
MLVPDVAVGAAGELAALRDTALDAVRVITAAAPERVVIVGAGTRTTEHEHATGSLRGLGVATDVALGSGGEPLPLALTLGTWLLQDAAFDGELRALELDPYAATSELDRVGRDLADGRAATALIVVADGSASRTDRAPASFHPEAEPFDADVSAALAAGEPRRLATLDRDRAAAVAAQGWPAWHVAAVAAAHADYDAVLLADLAPYGVGYFVATWLRTRSRA